MARALPRNSDVAEQLELLADLLELEGEASFRVLAYRRAATRIRESSFGSFPAKIRSVIVLSERLPTFRPTWKTGSCENLKWRISAVANCSITAFERKRGRVSLVTFNETGHLV